MLLSTAVLLCFCVVGVESFQCYKCNNKYNETCADKDGYPNGNLTKFLVNCEDTSEQPKGDVIGPDGSLKQGPLKAVGCRRVLQQVGTDKRWIRQCAYGGEAKDVKRTGNKGVSLFYYQCSAEKCNSAPSAFQRSSSFFAAIIAPTLLAFVIARL